MKTTQKELTEVSENTAFVGANADLAQLFAEELDGMGVNFDQIKVPGAGGLIWELPGETPDEPETAKEFRAVILCHHPVNTYYKDKYTGGNNPPDCGSTDGHVGIVMDTGEVVRCKDCTYNEFGSGENGAKACKQKRRLYLLREGEVLPVVLTVPSTSVGDYAKFVMRLLSKGQKTSSVVTKFSLKKAQSSTGIAYSQVVYSVDRVLTSTELASIEKMSEQVKRLAGKVSVAEVATTDE
jgi:hypothetical protein